jgi:hypothetical protein
MKANKKILTAALLSASVGFGTQSLLAQTIPGGTTGPTNASGPIAPMPRETQPTIPGQPAPGVPQTSPMPGQQCLGSADQPNARTARNHSRESTATEPER